MEEKWKSIEGYEGLYEISTMGRVKSIERKVKHRNSYITLREKILKPGKNIKGYLFVVLCKNGKTKQILVHRLVCKAFLPNPDNLPEVNHKDENPLNNNVENLEFCTHLYNINFGTRNERSAKAQINDKKKSKQVICIETGKTYPSTREIERQFGFNNSSISQCCRGKLKTCGKLHWKWAD